jgi:hypothetical protein
MDWKSVIYSDGRRGVLEQLARNRDGLIGNHLDVSARSE